MSNQEEINIEAIMQEIRTEIREKGYTNDLLSFNDIVIDTSTLNAVKFDKIAFNEEIYSINHGWEVAAYRVLSGNPVKVFFQKVIRKLVYFFVEPIVLEQNGFNASMVRLMNQMNCYIDETQQEKQALMEEIQVLRKKLGEKEE